MPVVKKTNTLSDARLARFNTAADRVLANGPQTGSDAPYGDTPTGDLWFEITGSTLRTGGAHNQWKYAGKLYRGAFTTQPISSATVYALNSFERNASSSAGAGYTFTATTCGSPNGLKALANGLRLLVVDRYRSGNSDPNNYYVISLRNNPNLTGVAGVQG